MCHAAQPVSTDELCLFIRTSTIHNEIQLYALTVTKTGVFVIDIKTIPVLFHLTNQPRQKFKLDLKNPCAV